MKRPEHPWLATILDPVMAPLHQVRAKVVPKARGAVLELGIGTGENLRHYGPNVTRLVGVEPDPYMLRRAEAKRDHAPCAVELTDDWAESLPFEDATFDTVVATFVLCTIPSPDRALAEDRRVLRPQGRLLFAEHVQHGHAAGRSLQNGLNRPWGFFAGGCQLNRDALALIRDAGFSIEAHRTHGAQAMTLFPIISGSAT